MGNMRERNVIGEGGEEKKGKRTCDYSSKVGLERAKFFKVAL